MSACERWLEFPPEISHLFGGLKRKIENKEIVNLLKDFIFNKTFYDEKTIKRKARNQTTMQYCGSVRSRTRVLRELHREQATTSNDHQRRKQTKIEHSESNEECNWEPDEANGARLWEHRQQSYQHFLLLRERTQKHYSMHRVTGSSARSTKPTSDTD